MRAREGGGGTLTNLIQITETIMTWRPVSSDSLIDPKMITEIVIVAV